MVNIVPHKAKDGEIVYLSTRETVEKTAHALGYSIQEYRKMLEVAVQEPFSLRLYTEPTEEAA